MLKEQIKRGNVTVDLQIDETSACRPTVLYINGIKASFYDFGRSMDINPELAPPCGCGNRVFVPKPVKEHIMKKYKLKPGDEKDLMIILKNKFSVGFCRRCD